MSDAPMGVRSHRGTYRVFFGEAARAAFDAPMPDGTHLLVDARVAGLYATVLPGLFAAAPAIVIEASEDAKSLERMPEYVESLLQRRVRRGHTLLGVGGGILQDITCFLAGTLLRGMDWRFVPTTLLAQADSCIGSKSSINVHRAKNIVGTYTPPTEVYSWPAFLDTLDACAIRSGVGEMLKVHAIHGPASFDTIARDYDALLADRGLMLRYIRRSLEIKRGLIEVDEFDRGPRNVLNYGHTFGHAIESATHFAIPHGIAVTMGMDLANFVALRLGRGGGPFDRMHRVLRRNYAGFEAHPIPEDEFFSALSKDKKNTATRLRVVLPDRESRIEVVTLPDGDRLRAAAREFMDSVRHR